jgi:hypothetical protein
MPTADPTHPQQPPAPRRVVPLVLIAVTVTGVGATYWLTGRSSRDGDADASRRTGASGPSNPELVQGPSRFKNLHPAVEYVGDSACVACHADIAESFRRHPMGRSLAPVTAKSAFGSPTRKTLASFESGGLHYAVEDKGGRVVHREESRGADGTVIVEREAEARFALGSGTRGTSFLLDQGGYLTQSAISWLAMVNRWGISPGYETVNPHFERPISNECLFCHANRYHAVTETSNKYRQPPFSGSAIGCERCHGPGSLHVKKREPREDGEDATIVNPRRLEPVLRDAVCEQCHLKGDVRIVRDGHDYLDFRPGLPLYRMLTVFFHEENLGERVQAVGHVEQMGLSRCATASDGKLACISCHDPHKLPAAEERVAYYRSRCLECHGSKPCALRAKTRLTRSPSDDCVSCHMPRAAAEDIAHAATTDHRIPRVAKTDAATGNAKPPARPPSGRLVDFHRGVRGAADRENIDRDFGVALAWLASDLGGSEAGVTVAQDALAKLNPVVQAKPADLIARESRAMALSLTGKSQEALEILQSVLAESPRREGTLVFAALLAGRTGRRDDAIALWRRALELNPGISARQFELATLLADKLQWAEAADACRAALAANPLHTRSRKLLIRCCLKTGEPERARAELEVLCRLEPKEREALQQWFAEQR